MKKIAIFFVVFVLFSAIYNFYSIFNSDYKVANMTAEYFSNKDNDLMYDKSTIPVEDQIKHDAIKNNDTKKEFFEVSSHKNELKEDNELVKKELNRDDEIFESESEKINDILVRLESMRNKKVQ